MLTLTLNNQLIPVSSDFSVQLTWKNPATDFEKIPSSYGFGFTFPINEYTKSIFGNPQRFSKSRVDNDQKFPGFEVRFSGVLLMSGTLQVNSASGGNYDATLINQVGTLGEKEQERYLTDIPQFSNLVYFVKKAHYTPGTDAYACFPVTNTDFFKEKGFVIELTRKVPDPNDETKLIDEKYDTELLTHLFSRTQTAILGELLGSRVNNNGDAGNDIQQFDSTIELHNKQNLNDSIPSASRVSVVSPFFFLNWVLKSALRDSHFTFTSENYLATHEALKSLCIYNTWDITYMAFTTTEFWLPFLFSLSETSQQAVGKIINFYMRENYNLVYPKNHLPKMKLGEAILSLQNLFNVCFSFLPNGTVNVYSRDEIIKGSAIDLDEYFLETWEIGEKKKVALHFTREHDDKDLIFSERYTDLSDRRADIKAPVWDWDALKVLTPDVGEIRFVVSAGIFAEFKWISVSADDPVTQKPQTNDVLGWEEISIGLQNGWYEFGREEVEKIKTQWSTLFANFGTPEAKQQGNTSAWPSKTQEFSPRLLFSFPGYGNFGSNAYDGASVSEDDILYLEYEKETNGLFARFWKAWNPFWANRLPVTGTFDLPVNALWYLTQNICKKYRTREGEFIIDEMSCEIFADHIGATEIKAYKVE